METKMTKIANIAEARALIEAGDVFSVTDVHVSKMGARQTSLRWYARGEGEPRVCGWSARRLTQAKKLIVRERVAALTTHNDRDAYAAAQRRSF